MHVLAAKAIYRVPHVYSLHSTGLDLCRKPLQRQPYITLYHIQMCKGGGPDNHCVPEIVAATSFVTALCSSEWLHVHVVRSRLNEQTALEV